MNAWLRWVCACVCALALLASVGAAAPPAGGNATSPDGWAHYLGDPQNTGVAGETGPGANATVAWTRTGPGYYTSSPAVVNGTLYVGVLDTEYGALAAQVRAGNDGPGRILALNATTGAVRWSVPTNGSVWTSPVYANGTVYAASVGGTVVALNASTGVERWRFDAGHPVYNGLTVSEGRVYVGTRDLDAHVLSHRSFPLYALDAATGGRLWEVQIPEGVFAAPAATERSVYVGGQNGTLYALDPATGREQWTFSADRVPGARDPAVRVGGIAASPAVRGGDLYVATFNGVLYALDAGTGRVRWEHDTGHSIAASPSVTERSVLVGNYGGTFFAFGRQNGSVRWRFSAGTPISKSAAAVAGDRVYVGSNGGTLFARTLSDGEAVWSLRARTPILSSPAVADGWLFVTSLERVFAVSPRGADRRRAARPAAWPAGTPGPVLATLAMAFWGEASPLAAVTSDEGPRVLEWTPPHLGVATTPTPSPDPATPTDDGPDLPGVPAGPRVADQPAGR
ncbi:MAG: PQQ-binding-like beta-propeller repeat protein [Halorientalis sp.]